MIKEYENYHKHTVDSNPYTPDSTVFYQDYFDRTVELGGKIITTVEHGWCGNNFDTYLQLEKFNKKLKSQGKEPLKFVVGGEFYWVKDRHEKDNSNCHMVILARNENGRKKINKIMSQANKDGYYYKPRIDLELIKSLPKEDVFITSACVAGWKYEDAGDIFVELSKIFPHFFLEIQYHNTEKQIELNKKILKLSREHNIPMIVGTDSHMITHEGIEERDDFLRSNKIFYDDEEGWYLDYPTAEEIYERFRAQEVFTEEEIDQAMLNTLKTRDFENIVYDKSMKVPTIYKGKSQEERNDIFKQLINQKWIETREEVPREKWDYYLDQIRYEVGEILGCGMADYFTSNYEIMKLGIDKYGGTLTFSGRGCFTEDALVHTKNSIKSIKDIKVGDYVVTANGKFNKVLKTMKYNIEEELVQIKHIYGTNKNYPSICTLDHKILINRNNEIKWICAKDIIKGDYVCVPKIKTIVDNNNELIDLVNYNIGNFEFDDEYIYEKTSGAYKYSPSDVARKINVDKGTVEKFANMGKNCFSRKKEKYDELMNYIPFNTQNEYSQYVKSKQFNKINRYLKIDEEFNVFIGLMYGDGFTHKGSVGLAINNTTEKDKYNRMIFNNISNKLGKSVYENRSKTKKLSQLFINSTTFCNFVEQELFKSKKDKEKTFKERWFNQSKKCLLGIIKGLRQSDGSFCEERINFDNTSKSLINAYKLLCLMTNEGVNSLSIRKSHITKEGYECKESYKLRLNKNYKNAKKISERVVEDDKYFYLPIREIKMLQKQKTTVYDIEVENEHNYLLNNMIVHNSGASEYVNKLLEFTNVDRISARVTMFPERFMTKERILESHTPPDIDHNVATREPFKKAQEELFGSAYDLIAFGTLKFKSAWKMYARAYDVSPSDADIVSKQIDKYEDKLKHAERDEATGDLLEEVDIHDYVEEKYWKLLEGCKKYLGIKTTRKGHPCGCLATDLDVEEEVGVILCKSETTKKEVLVACIESGNIDYFGWLKQDYLVVDVVRTIKETYDRIGIPQHSIRELLEITANDKKTWDIYANGLTLCVNQVEKEGSKVKTMQYKPFNEVELCALIAGIRPSFASLIKTFLKREEFNYDITALDNLIQTEEMPYSFILYQEQLMQILGFAGFPMKETYDIIKSVSKKKMYCKDCGLVGNSSMHTCPHCGSTNISPLVDKFKEQFIEGFSKKIEEAKNKEEVANKVWHIVLDFAGYGFNASHSYCMALDSLYQAYLKAHYPLHFYETMLRRYTEKGQKDKVKALKEEMRAFKIHLGELKFGEDNRNFILNEETNTITQSLVAIKGVSQIVANQIYEVSKRKNEFNSFIEIRDCIKKEYKGIEKDQLEALIKIGYFSEYGSISYLKKTLELYDDWYSRKVFRKDGSQMEEVIKKFAKKETAKQYKDFDTVEIINYLLSKEFNYISVIEKALIEFRAYGEITIVDEEYCSSTCIAIGLNDRWATKKVTFYNISTGRTCELKIGGGYYEMQPIQVGDVVDVFHTFERPKKESYEVEEIDNNGEVIIKRKYRNSKTEFEKWCDEFMLYTSDDIEELVREEYRYKNS